jgi:hypothetical protein
LNHVFTTNDEHEAAIPVNWTKHIHPEGAPYYVNGSLHVVTDSDITESSVFELVNRTIGEVQALSLAAKSVSSNSVELYIRVDDAEENKCSYYLVDHATRTEFWLHSMTNADLGLQQACSAAHLSV